MRFDTGGSGKGLAADALAHRLDAYERAIVDCAGDVRLAGPGFARTPMHVTLRHPLTGRDLAPLAPLGGAVATSGIDGRVGEGEMAAMRTTSSTPRPEGPRGRASLP